MACKELRTEINGMPIYARQWDATQALANSALMMNVCGQYVLPFVEGTATFDDVLRMLTNVPHEQLIPLIKRFVFAARTTDAAGNPQELSELNINQLCSGKLIDIVLIFKAICELQYKDFFEQGLALLPRKVV